MSIESHDQQDINLEESERRGEALDLLVSIGSGSDEIPDPNASENMEEFHKYSEALSSYIKRGSFDKAAQVYLALAKCIGTSPSENPQIVETVARLKDEIKNTPQFLEVLDKKANLLTWLNSYSTHLSFLDGLMQSLPALVARIYYPERFKYLINGLIETDDLSIDDIYSGYLAFLEKNIENSRKKGHKEDKLGGDSLGTYLSIHKQLTGE